MKRYFKYRWNETRDDEFEGWGFSTQYSETDEELFPIRQIEIYDNGIALKYDNEHLEDRFKFSADKSIEDVLENPNNAEISKEDFENLWTSHKAFNS